MKTRTHVPPIRAPPTTPGGPVTSNGQMRPLSILAGWVRGWLRASCSYNFNLCLCRPVRRSLGDVGSRPRHPVLDGPRPQTPQTKPLRGDGNSRHIFLIRIQAQNMLDEIPHTNMLPLAMTNTS
ncbi:hypothetical protein AAHA92_31035 [Salvia divinorum]|uniref:Uncharacterized protein n=1 Tax=Salvia divinorum TaxID=28513 RepID=A0ABD1FTV2_SALDI